MKVTEMEQKEYQTGYEQAEAALAELFKELVDGVSDSYADGVADACSDFAPPANDD